MLRRPLTVIIALIGIATLAAAIFFLLREPEAVEAPFQPRESHDAYRAGLQQLELDETFMGESWMRAARQSLEDATRIALPYAETVLLDPDLPDAVSVWFPVTRGRQVSILIDAEHEFFFADVYRLDRPGGSDQASMPAVEQLVASRNENRIVFEARRNAFYLLRIQPELLRGGRFSVSIRESASLAFPVQGTDERDIWSFYGDPRDGGRREHHGIDIFAPRGTPVLAASRSEVVRVGERDRGGLVVVLFDRERELMLYYAHLDEQWVREGTTVEAGDPIGTVGNTGNAISTPPHLHLGLYQGGWRRPVDPWPFFLGADGRPRSAGDMRATTASAGIPELIDEALQAAELSRDGQAGLPLGVWTALTRDAELSNAAADADGFPPVSSLLNRNRYFRNNRTPAVFQGTESDPDTAWILPPSAGRPAPGGLPLAIVGVSENAVRVRDAQGRHAKLDADLLQSISDPMVREYEVQQRSALRDPDTGDMVQLVQPGTRLVVVAPVDAEAGRLLVRRSPDDERVFLLAPLNVPAAG